MPSDPADAPAKDDPATPPRVRGTCHAVFCYDLGFAIDLDALEQRLSEPMPAQPTRLRVVRVRRPAPAWFEYEPAPLRLTLDADTVAIGATRTEPAVECLVYDFGAVAITYRLPFDGTLDELAELSASLYDNEQLLDDSRGRAGRLLSAAGDAIQRASLSHHAEDYLVFALDRWSDGPADAHCSAARVAPGAFVDRHADALARVLQSERGRLSAGQTAQALSGRLAYSADDLAVIDWNAAMLFDEHPGDVLAVLTHANVELLEMRWLDTQLDRQLESAQRLLPRIGRGWQRWWPGGEDARAMRRFAELQTDSAVLFEGVNNAIKLIGDQYLARLYDTAAGKLHLTQWDASVLRKLATAESVYQKMSDAAGTRRMEILEWIIILLILFSILMPFLPGMGK